MSADSVVTHLPGSSKKRKHGDSAEAKSSKKRKESREKHIEGGARESSNAFQDGTPEKHLESSTTVNGNTPVKKKSNSNGDTQDSVERKDKKLSPKKSQDTSFEVGEPLTGGKRLGEKKEKKKKKKPRQPQPPAEAGSVTGFDAQSVDEEVVDNPQTGNQFEEERGEIVQSQAPSDYQVSISSSNSPFYLQTSSFYLPLASVTQKWPLGGLCAEHISPLLLTYSEALKGIILSYSNLKLSNGPTSQTSTGSPVLAEIIDEYAVSFIWLTADFLILRPDRGVELEGHIAVQSESHLGLICWNLFNANIAADQLPPGWTWSGARNAGKKSKSKKASSNEYSTGSEALDGHYIDEDGRPVGGTIKFRVLDFEVLPSFGKDRSFMSIEGTLLAPANEENNADSRKAWSRKSKDTHQAASQQSPNAGRQSSDEDSSEDNASASGSEEIDDEGEDLAESNASDLGSDSS